MVQQQIVKAFENNSFYWFWSRGLVKSRQKNWRESRSRETEVGEKIAVTNKGILAIFVGKCSSVPTNWIKNLAMTALFLTTNFCVVQYHIYFLKENQILHSSIVVIKFLCNNSILCKIKVSPTTIETNHGTGTEFFVIDRLMKIVYIHTI